jgi:ribonuclease HI
MSHESNKLVIHADGGISPRQAGIGVVVQDIQGQVLLVANRTIPKPMTNNEAEYLGLIMALEIARRYGTQPIEIRLDSEVVINQMMGNFAVRSTVLKPLHRQACELARQLPNLQYKYVPRELNMVANALAYEATAGRRCSTKGVG